MSRKPRKKSGISLLHRGRISSQQWQALSYDHDLARAFQDLSLALQQAQAVAVQKSVRLGGHPSQYLDLSRAMMILGEKPELVAYVNDIARQASTVPSDFVQLTPDVLRASPSGVASPQLSQDYGTWAGSLQKTTDGVVNARLLRDWADSNEWTRAAINVRRQQIGRANIAVVPFNERKPYNRSLIKQVQLLLDQPNEYRQNYSELMSAVIDDVLVIDRGVILKDMTVDRKPVHLYNEDGACIRIYPGWSGNPDEPRYLYESASGNRRVPLRNDEAIVIMANPATYRFGLSPVQVLRNTIQADLEATQQARRIVRDKPPPHLIQIPGATQAQLDAIKMKYETDIAGNNEIFWLAGQNPAHVSKLVFSAKDNQWLEWQVYLARKIAVVFQISPQQLGITFDINKATASSQQEIFEDTGLIPLLLLIEEYFNTELLADFAPKYPDGRANMMALNLRILFPEVTEADRQMHAERAVKLATSGLAGLPSMTLNQVLSMFGEEPVEGGNTFYLPNTSLGAIPWLSYDGKTGDYSPLGSQGEQDEAGGPNMEEDIPKPSRHRKPTAPPSNAPVAPSSGTTSPEPSGSSSSDRPSAPAKAWQERRMGKRWTPTSRWLATAEDE